MTCLTATSSATGSIFGCCLGFISKQLFCYQFLQPIQQRLNEVITKIATARIGGFAANIIGPQLSIVFSVPVTLFLSDMVYCAIKEAVETIIALFTRQFILQPKSFEQEETLFSKVCCVVKKVVTVATFYLTRAYFCHYGMPLVKTGTELLLRQLIAAPAFIPVHIVGFTATAIAIIAAPSLTFFFSDIVGFAAQEAASFLVDRTVELVTF